MDLSFLGPAASSVIIVAMFLRFQRESTDKLSASIDRNTEITKETKDFLTNLNGQLKKAYENKMKGK